MSTRAKDTSSSVHIVGSGLAGSEAAYFLAENGIGVNLYEMRPHKMTPAHKSGDCAELVCSNSLKSTAPESAPGILKAEMNSIGSLILSSANQTQVPGGEALTVNRELFSKNISEIIKNHTNINFVEEEVIEPFKNEITLIATGPLSSPAISKSIAGLIGSDDLYFYDAIAPIVDASTIDIENTFLANRYGKGGDRAYLNCPLTENEYNDFLTALLGAETVAPKNFEKEKFFGSCQPIEAIALSGRDTLRFGPMKPVGLEDPKTGKRPYAVIQLRTENIDFSAYNIVGFQTKLKYSAQKEVFRKIPALKNAEFLRMGSVHRNTFINSPKLLYPDLTLKGREGKAPIYFAGQITGVEGYVESAACGLLAGIFILQKIKKTPHTPPPANTALGVLLRHLTTPEKKFQPSNINFGLFNSVFFENAAALKKNELRLEIAKQSVINLRAWWNTLNFKKPKTGTGQDKSNAKENLN